MLGSRELKLSSLSRLDLVRFWSQVEVHGRSYGPRGKCWPWRGPTDRKGYGTFSAQGLTHLAHRVAYAYFHDIAPANVTIRHSCDNEPCCQPGHILSGSNADNVADRVARNRGGSPLTVADVYEIRRLLSAGIIQRVIGAKFGVTQSTIGNIARGVTWSHLPERPEHWRDPAPMAPTFTHDPLLPIGGN